MDDWRLPVYGGRTVLRQSQALRAGTGRAAGRYHKEPKESFLDHDTAREAIIPHMLETMQQQNKTYAVIDGFPIPQQCVRVITLDFNPWEVVLASDGYPFLEPTLEASEQRLEWQRKNDPLNIGEFKATKAFSVGSNSFDDRAYIRFKV